MIDTVPQIWYLVVIISHAVSENTPVRAVALEISTNHRSVRKRDNPGAPATRANHIFIQPIAHILLSIAIYVTNWSISVHVVYQCKSPFSGKNVQLAFPYLNRIPIIAQREQYIFPIFTMGKLFAREGIITFPPHLPFVLDTFHWSLSTTCMQSRPTCWSAKPICELDWATYRNTRITKTYQS